MAAAPVDKLAKDLAFKANVDAVTRDYICEPRLGALRWCSPEVPAGLLRPGATHSGGAALLRRCSRRGRRRGPPRAITPCST